MGEISMKKLLNNVGFEKILVVDDEIYKTMGEVEGFAEVYDVMKQNNPTYAADLDDLKGKTVVEFLECKGNKFYEEFYKQLTFDKEENKYSDAYKEILKDFSSDEISLHQTKETFIEAATEIDDKTLVFIDVNFNDENNVDFRSILEKLCSGNKQVNFVIYSNEEFETSDFSSIKATLKRYLQDDFETIIKDSSWLKYTLSFLSKSSDDLQVDLMKQIRKNYKLKYLKKIEEATRAFTDELQKEFFDIQNNEEKRHHFYLTEGMNSSEILEEIINNKFIAKVSSCRDEQIFEDINRSTNLYYSLFDPKKIKEKVEEGEKKNVNENFDKLFSEDIECYSLYDKNTDIRKGDLLEIFDRKFVVLTQDCDLVIRELDKDLRKKNVCLVQIVIEEKNEEEVQSIKRIGASKRKKKLHEYEHRACMFDKSFSYVASEGRVLEVKEEIHVPLVFLNYMLHHKNENNVIRFSTKEKIKKITDDNEYIEFYKMYLSRCIGNDTTKLCESVTRIGKLTSTTIDYVTSQWVTHKTRQAFNKLPAEL